MLMSFTAVKQGRARPSQAPAVLGAVWVAAWTAAALGAAASGTRSEKPSTGQDPQLLPWFTSLSRN